MNEEPLNSQIEPSMDEYFLLKIREIVLKNLSNENFSIDLLIKEVGISRSQVHRKLKRITGKSVSHIICEIRLEEALKLLNGNVATSAEIAYRVGFSSPNYFIKCFRDHYGYTPGEMKKMLISGKAKINEVDGEDLTELKIFKSDLKVSSITNKKLTRKWILLLSAFIIVIFSIAGSAYFYFIRGNRLDDTFHSKKELSIIVLPLKNLTADPNSEWLVDGFAEDILNNLCNITSLGVVPRTSAEQFRESTLSIPEIGRKMSVNYVLEGSLRYYRDRIKITINLTDVSSNKYLWSQTFDEELVDIIGMQGDIALQVAHKLNAVLSDKEIRQIKKIPTQNPEAYTYYLQARFLLHKANDLQRSGFSKKSVMNCIQYYEKAIDEDENFAEAYAGLANAWFILSAWGMLPGGFPKARELSMKALEIDPECAEAHAILGALLVWGQRNFEKGGKELQTSIHLNPNFATSRQMYAQFLMITGPIKEARKQIDFAMELEPYFWVVQNVNAYIYYFEEKYDKAVDACILAHNLNPDFIINEWLLFLNYTKLDDGEKAVQMLQTIVKHYPESDQHVDEIREVYNESGINGLFNWLIDINTNKPINVVGMNGHPFYIAWWNVILGNKDEAVYWLEKNMQEKQKLYHYFDLIATNPDFDILRNDPRFLKIVDEIGLTPYHKRKAK